MIDRSRYTDAELARIDARLCLLGGCAASIKHRSLKTLFCSSKHRKAHYRARLKEAAEAAGLPSNLSMTVARETNRSGERPRDAHKPRQPTQRRNPRPGLSVYFRSLADAELAERLLAESADAREMLGRAVDDAPLTAIRAALARRCRRAA